MALETWEVAEHLYENVRVREVTPATVTIFHSGGIRQFDLSALPRELQERFGYDPEQAEAWKSAEAEARSAALARQTERTEQLRAERLQAEASRSGEVLVVAPEEVRFFRELDLRPFYLEKGLVTKNQGRRPSCSVFALVSALEYEQARRAGEAERLSEEFLIWATLQVQPGIPLDTGFNFPEVITALQTFGVPPHAVMPNTLGRRVEDIRPSKEAVEAARPLSSVVPVWFRRNDPYLVERIVSVLNQKKPVIIGVRWPHWRTLANNHLLKNQKPLEQAAHAVTLIGYRNIGGTPEGTTFIFRNSYGNDWGEAGCGFIHARYLRENLIGAFYLKLP